MNAQQTILSEFKITVAVDTQILAYLIDNTYPKLTLFFECLRDCPYVDIVCSRFATYEFTGIRKQEHYLRAIHNKSNLTSGVMNFSSVLKYKNSWSAPELPYEDIYEDIKNKVEEDLKKANDDFGIVYSDGLHQDLWGPQQDLVLSSKISKEDSLVLLSSIIPNVGTRENFLIFFTNDDQFHKAFSGGLRMDSIDEVFTKHSLNQPNVIKIDNIKTPVSSDLLNLIKCEKTDDEVKSFVSTFIFENIQIKNPNLLLGKIVSCPTSMAGKLLCFELSKPVLNNDIYISILSSDLEFLYNHESKLSSFYNKNEITDYPYSPGPEDTAKNISVQLVDNEGNFLPIDEYNRLTKNGNLVFIHPDSLY